MAAFMDGCLMRFMLLSVPLLVNSLTRRRRVDRRRIRNAQRNMVSQDIRDGLRLNRIALVVVTPGQPHGLPGLPAVVWVGEVTVEVLADDVPDLHEAQVHPELECS